MGRNPTRNVLLFIASVILLSVLGTALWLWITKRQRAAWHDHESRRRATPCLILPLDNPTAEAGLGVIADCLLLQPDGRPLDVVEVNLRNGLFVMAKTDLYVPGEIPIALTRVYRPGDAQVRGFGLSSDHVYNILPVGDRWPYTFLDLCFEDGQRVHYDRISPGVAYGDAVYENFPRVPPVYAGSQFRWAENGWELRRKDGWRYSFPPGDLGTRAAQGALVSLQTPEDKVLQLTRKLSGDLTKIESPGGTWVRLEYADHEIVRAEDSSGRRVHYDYDGKERIRAVRDSPGVVEFSYDDQGNLAALTENGAPVLRVGYDSHGRVANLWLPRYRAYRFRYRVTSDRKLRTEITGPNGQTAVVQSTQEGYTATGWPSAVDPSLPGGPGH